MTDQHCGRRLRLNRLSRFADGRFLFVPLDHSVSDGPLREGAAFAQLVDDIVRGGADAVVVHKGRVRLLPPDLLTGCALVVQLSASTRHAADRDDKVLVGDVEEAVRLGADAVAVHINIGSDTEQRQLADLGAVARECDRLGTPLLAMVYPRGPRVTDPHDPDLLAHVVNIAADLGADLVKTTWAEPWERLADVVAASPLPVLVAGGPANHADVTSFARAAMAAGCAGLAIGRRVFGAPEPRAVVTQLVEVVHGLPIHSFDSSTHRVLEVSS
jgi:2-amino-4,5-dihydroxy-6-oxo-7-(phosphonooxy)heptanoate synthase